MAFVQTFRCRISGPTLASFQRRLSGNPAQKKESVMTFTPLKPADKYLERRKEKFYEKFASEKGKTSKFYQHSETVAGFFSPNLSRASQQI
jgi:hypothetical protein